MGLILILSHIGRTDRLKLSILSLREDHETMAREYQW